MTEHSSAPARVSEGSAGVIRPLAAAVIRDGDRLLVWEDHDPVSGDVVCVPLAGGIEFGEAGAEAIARELEEEIGHRPSRVAYLGLLEDIFDWNGQKRHELYLVFDVDLSGTDIRDRDEVVVTEDDGTSYAARWRQLDEFRGPARLVPDGLLDLIERSSAPDLRLEGARSPRLVGINHVALQVDDIEQAVDFYTALFQPAGVDRTEPGAAFLAMGDQTLALFERGPRSEEPHFGLVVDDKEAARRTLRDAGVEILPGDRLDFRDPSGNVVQVVQYDQIQFTKTDRVLKGMGLDLGKSARALAELRRNGLAD